MVTPPEIRATPSGSVATTWGGDRLQLTIDAIGAGRVELDCASGAIVGPLVLSEKGTFVAVGTFAQHRGGPQRAEEAAASAKARYEGEVKSDEMILSILPEGAAQPQVFKLRKGAKVKLVRCF